MPNTRTNPRETQARALTEHLRAKHQALAKICVAKALEPYSYESGHDTYLRKQAIQTFKNLTRKEPVQVRKANNYKELWQIGMAELDAVEGITQEVCTSRSIVTGAVQQSVQSLIEPLFLYPLLLEKVSGFLQQWGLKRPEEKSKIPPPWLLVGADEVVWCPPPATSQIVNGVYDATWP